MSEWKSVLKSTSIEKQTSDEAMDKLLEGLGKVIADYSKEKATNQPTTPELTPQQKLEQQQQQRAKQQMETGYRGAPDKRVTSDKPFAASTPKPATGFKALSQKEVEAMKGFGYTDKHIKELDKQRLKQYGEAPPSLGQQVQQTAGQVGQQVRQKVQQLPQWMKNLRNKPTGKPEAQDVRVDEGGTVRSRSLGGSYDKEGPSGFGVAAPPKQSKTRTQIASPKQEAIIEGKRRERKRGSRSGGPKKLT